jgi:hypothetical protein
VNSIDNFTTASNVGAAFTNSGSTTEYTFVSLVDESPVNGVPGLAAYCVYTDAAPTSVLIDPAVEGANGQAWVVSGKFSKNFAFLRPGGAKSDIPLEGQTITMGTATWAGNAPATQTILLHIDDPAVCSALYGTALTTCFVKPTEVSLLPVCDAAPLDLTGVVYTSLARDSINCAPPSEAFEAQSAREFGDEVTLSSVGELKSLTVQFQSYGCRDGGHWNLGATDPCVTNAPGTFDHDITANIYDPSVSLTVPLATLTQTFAIQYRPTANPGKCPGGEILSQGIEAGSQWFNDVSQTCQYSIGQQLTFNFPAGTTLPSTVVWTVAFNTSDYGSPLRPQPCNSLPQGCGYDSLNVGTKTYTGAPYVGTDVDPNGAYLSSTWGGAYCDNGIGGTGSLRLDTGTGQASCWYNLSPPLATPHLPPNDAWAPYKPLGQINIQ